MKCLGFVFEKDGKIIVTKAGKDLALGAPPLPIMQSMLLTHQYPSAYGYLRNVRMHPQMRVKPFLFVLKLLNHPNITYLTNEELAVPIIFGHTNDCFDLCVKKIRELRNGSNLSEILINKKLDLYRPRASSDNSINDILDIANTCKNYLQACCLISVETLNRRERIYFSDDMRPIYNNALKSENDFIEFKSEESFQRAYGAWDRIKDTRRIFEPERKVISGEESVILSQFYRLCGEKIISGIPNEFVDQMHLDYGFDRNLIIDTVLPHAANSLDFFEATYLELSKAGTSKSTEFEKTTCGIFKDKLHFNARHTGQLRRPDGVGNYSDVFVIALDNQHCGIIDAKASPSYNLPATDYHAMANNYIRNYSDLTNGKPMELEFCMYVAGGFTGDMNQKLKCLKKETGTDCSALRAYDLLNLTKMFPLKEDQIKIRKILKAGNLLTMPLNNY